MALIGKIESSPKERQSVHQPTRCHYSVVDGSDGNRYVQLDTYGTEGREFPDKISQSVQIGREGAVNLLKILREVFPDLL